MAKENYSIETLVVHGGYNGDPQTGSRSVPIIHSNAYEFHDAEHAARLFNLEEFGNIYTRLTNPTNGALEERVTALEGGAASLAVASGHAAQFITIITLMQAGDNFIAATHLYGGAIAQFSSSFSKLGIKARFAQTDNIDAFRNQIDENTKAIYVEFIANPGGLIPDLEALGALAAEHKIPLIVDNTVASPYLCQPFKHGANIIIHSATKFLGGHGISMAGVIVDGGNFDWKASGKFPLLTEPEPAYHGIVFAETFGNLAFILRARAVGLRDFGPCLSPTNAFHILTGIETLAIRMDRHSENTLRVAEYLENHPKVEKVTWAGLKSSPYYPLAQKYLKTAGSLFTFTVKGGYEAGKKLIDNVELWTLMANLGDTRSVISHPASTTHRQVPAADLEKAGAGPGEIRLSVGIENADDLIADLAQALDKI